MPFINDRLEATKEASAQQRYEQQAARQSRFKFDPVAVIEKLRERIIGQEPALRILEDTLFTIKADFSSAQRPLFVILLLGPTGVGKTETVRVMTEAILGSADKLCRIDMNTLAQEHYSAAITGSPPGYVGSKEGQTLFDVEKIQGQFSEPGIVLFDEIEKANQDVTRAIMNILDTGTLTLTSGAKQINFRNSIIFMTSNIGARELAAHSKKSQSFWRRLLSFSAESETDIIDRCLHAHFDPEFLNRIDHVLPFKRLSNTKLRDIVAVEIEKLNKRLLARDAAVDIREDAMNYLVTHYDARFGARDLLRRMRKELEPKIAKALIEYPYEREFIASAGKKELVVEPGKSV